MRKLVLVTALAGSALAAGVVSADPTPAAEKAAAEKAPPAADEAKEEAPADGEAQAADADIPPHIEGPRKVDLGHQIEIDLPAGYILFERAQAEKMLRENGDSPEGVLALVGHPEGDWLLSIEFDDVGHVSDHDADDLDADDLLDSYREGTKEQNKKRKALGVHELFVDGWTDKPRYDKATRQLIWGLKMHTSENQGVLNVSTNLLGRHGYASTVLMVAPENLAAAQQQAASVIGGVHFLAGARYQDYDPSKDKDSGLSLGGLVLGGVGVAVASKLGLIAKILLVFKKGFLVIFIGIGGAIGWIRRRMGGKPAATPPATEAAGDPPTT